MRIDEAVKIALKENKCIRRNNNSALADIVRFIPTNTPDGVIVIIPEEKRYACWWHPEADDLTADDWEVCELKKEYLSFLR